MTRTGSKLHHWWMEADVPRWPDRITREQARAKKERELRFTSAIKHGAKAAGWRFSAGSLFRQRGDWFVSALPSLLWQRGAIVMSMSKPMGIDPIFWDIIGLPENNALPLSFRANGAWVLRPPQPNTYVALEEGDPEKLAEAVITWADGWSTDVEAKSLEVLISEMEDLGPLRYQFTAFEICLHLLRRDYVRALEIIGEHAEEESGGFVTGEVSFLEQAKAWIGSKAI